MCQNLELSLDVAMSATMTIIQAPAGQQVQQASLVELGKIYDEGKYRKHYKYKNLTHIWQ